MASFFDPSRFGFQPSQSARSQWRDLSGPGVLNGLPGSQGMAVATNGILIVIQRQQDYIIGHLDAWIPYKEPKEVKATSPRKERKRKPCEEIEFL